MRKSVALLFVLSICSTISAQTLLRAGDLQKDYLLLRQAYETLHPGLYQYTSKAVTPNVPVEPSLEDLFRGGDTELAIVKKLIKERQ